MHSKEHLSLPMCGSSLISSIDASLPFLSLKVRSHSLISVRTVAISAGMEDVVVVGRVHRCSRRVEYDQSHDRPLFRSQL